VETIDVFVTSGQSGVPIEGGVPNGALVALESAHPVAGIAVPQHRAAICKIQEHSSRSVVGCIRFRSPGSVRA